MTNPFVPIYTSQQNGAISLSATRRCRAPRPRARAPRREPVAIVTGSSNSAMTTRSRWRSSIRTPTERRRTPRPPTSPCQWARSAPALAAGSWPDWRCGADRGHAPHQVPHAGADRLQHTHCQQLLRASGSTTLAVPGVHRRHRSGGRRGGNGTGREPTRRVRRPLRRVVTRGRPPRNPALPLRWTRPSSRASPTSTPTADDEVTIPISGFLTPACCMLQRLRRLRHLEGDRGAYRPIGPVEQHAVERRGAGPSNNFFNSGISDAGVSVSRRQRELPQHVRCGHRQSRCQWRTAEQRHVDDAASRYGGRLLLPGYLLTTQIDLYMLAFNPSKTVTDLSGTRRQVGDTLEYQVSFTNTVSMMLTAQSSRMCSPSTRRSCRT